MGAIIRQYDPSGDDKGRIYDICCDAGYFGDPIDEIFVDRAWFADFMVGPYLVVEPEHTWVAEVDGRVVGYLNGSLFPWFGPLRAQMEVVKVVEIYWSYVFGKYNDHARSLRFAEFVLTEALFQLPKHPKDAAHFHFNVDADFRHRGIGGQLLDVFEEALGGEGIKQYYAEVLASDGTRSNAYFVDLGYEIYDQVPTTVFEKEVPELSVLCVTKRLAA